LQFIIIIFPPSFIDQTSTLSVHVTQEPFGVIQTSKGDESVSKYTLTNLHGVKVQLITYGAALTNLLVPDKEGRLQDVVLGFDDLDGMYRLCYISYSCRSHSSCKSLIFFKSKRLILFLQLLYWVGGR
jgi:hypothetical protein